MNKDFQELINTFEYSCNNDGVTLVNAYGRRTENKNEKQFDDGKLLKVRSGKSCSHGYCTGFSMAFVEGWTEILCSTGKVDI